MKNFLSAIILLTGFFLSAFPSFATGPVPNDQTNQFYQNDFVGDSVVSFQSFDQCFVVTNPIRSNEILLKDSDHYQFETTFILEGIHPNLNNNYSGHRSKVYKGERAYLVKI
jgi:hypothetical protein